MTTTTSLTKPFHKTIKNQWSPDARHLEAPIDRTARQALALTNTITPVYLGEQAAMNGPVLVLPQLISQGETAAQL